MTVAVANTELANTYDYLRNRVNELATAMSNVVFTAGGTVPAGNLVFSDSIEANAVYVRSALRGGNTGTANALIITSNVVINSAINATSLLLGNSSVNVAANSTTTMWGANVVVNTSTLFAGNSTVNTSVTSTNIFLGNSSANAVVNASGFYLNSELFTSDTKINVQTSGTSAQVIDQFATGTFRGAEYLFNVKDNALNQFTCVKLLIVHDAANAYITEYGVINTNNPLGTFSTDVSGANCRILFTPVEANTQVKGTRSAIVI